MAGRELGLVPLSGTVEAVVESLAHGGEGVAHVDGRVVFVPWSAPGERVLATVVEDHPRWARARLERILQPSPERTEPRCPLFGRCGGCRLQHLPAAAQRAAKGRAVTDLLERIGGQPMDGPVECLAAAAEWEYRQRATLSWRREPGGGLRLGFHGADDSAEIVDVPACPILDARISAKLGDIRRALERGLADGAEEGEEGRLALRARPGREVEAGVFAGDAGAARRIADRLASTGIPATWGRRAGTRLELDRDAPRLETRLAYRDLNLRVGFDSFLQADLEAATTLYDAALEALDAEPGERVIDGYAGIGVLACELARSGVRVTAVEGHAGAASDLRSNLAAAGGEVHVLEIAAERLDWRRPRPDAIVVNPPRGGCTRPVIEGIARSGASRLVYVACEPSTLARDVRRLGPVWRLDRVRSFDLFPQTAHVETILRMRRT